MNGATPTPDAVRSVPRICPLCEAGCGLMVQVQAHRVIGIRGDEADPFSRGYLCPKAAALKDLHDDPDRLRQPLVRRDGRLQPASWEEALAEVHRRLPPLIAAHGRDAVAITLGNPIVHKPALALSVPALVKALGSHNVFSASTLDQMPKQLASGLMFGHWLTVAVPDIDRTDHLLILGGNPAVSNGSLWTVPDFRGRAKALRERGGRLVVVDPRRTETAALADRHHFIRPGGDVFLLLGMVHTLFAEDRVRLGRLAEHVEGLDALRDAVRPFAPERMAAHCGLDAPTVRQLARELAEARSGCVYGRMGTSVQAFGTLCAWLIDVLNVLTGHLDAPGGAMFNRAAAFAANTRGKPGTGRGVTTGRWASRVSGAPEVMGELPITCLAEEIETPGDRQVRALVTVASNPVLSAPDGPRLAGALDGLDFMVSVDLYLNETSRHADVVLPGRSPLEEPHYDVALSQLAVRRHARYSAPVLPTEQPSEWTLLLQLGAIARGDHAWQDPDTLDDAQLRDELRRSAGDHAEAVFQALAGRRGPDRLLDLALRTGPEGDGFGARAGGLTLDRVSAAAHGLDLGPLTPRIPEVLRTPSGRIELAPPALLADLPRVQAVLDAPAAAADDRPLLIGRRDVRSNNSWMHNLPVLAKGRDRCTLLLHPQDAARWGLADGGLARLTGDTGHAVLAVVECSDAMMRGVVSLPHGWGHDLAGAALSVAAARPGANVNALVPAGVRDPLSGNAVLNGVRVTVAPA
ncbi:molybdopterin-dependent oxidoreductase [Aquabacterium sp. J223]|uniref:molybdopterin-dependent oxidoreductase n=1 Tax=Aquabacterium sp. J223 TaxID=2898431 RepID=UPI0021ADD133|nr:molybdopterin-dependent oxidoreductase [Aquabacterium sp. J223]UUX97681.1 molybdopterin-dependent oxidoreductase [Aquabacterium sp. J223]